MKVRITHDTENGEARNKSRGGRFTMRKKKVFVIMATFMLISGVCVGCGNVKNDSSDGSQYSQISSFTNKEESTEIKDQDQQREDQQRLSELATNLICAIAQSSEKVNAFGPVTLTQLPDQIVDCLLELYSCQSIEEVNSSIQDQLISIAATDPQKGNGEIFIQYMEDGQLSVFMTENHMAGGEKYEYLSIVSE